MTNQKHITLVIGVSGTGKSTIAEALAARAGGQYLDADDFHPGENVKAMAAGVPLNDEMRAGWLEIVCEAMKAESNDQIFLACSALKTKYRDVFRQHFPQVDFILLDADEQVLSERMAARVDHYMPVSLLKSQIATLELPTVAEQDVLVLDGTLPIADILERSVKHLERDVN